MTALIVEIVITLTLSAFFSGMEIAFVSSNRLLFEMDKANNGITQKVLSIFYKNSNNFISTLLVGNNIALVVYGILMAKMLNLVLIQPLGIGTDEEWFSLIILTIISTLIVLVTSEFLPKTLFKINPIRTLTIGALPMFLFYCILFPISRLSSGLAKFMLLLLGIHPNKEDSDKAFTKIDLDNLIQDSIDHSDNEEEIRDEVRIFQNALDFSETRVRDCIVPRTEIEAMDINSPIEELKNKFIESGKSKILIYEGDIDHIKGYIHSSEMFRHADNWKKYLRSLPIVPETMTAQKMMKYFMQQTKSLAVVVDEFGGTSGIVSLEDLVEEIFGDIEDEHDNNNYIAKQVNKNTYILSARLEIEKVNEQLHLDLPESDEYITIGGYILHEHQNFPKLNEEVKFGKYEFKILKNTTTKIELVRLKVM